MVTIVPGRFGLVDVSVTPHRTQGMTPDGVLTYLTRAGCPVVTVPMPFQINQVPVVSLAVKRGLARWSDEAFDTGLDDEFNGKVDRW